MNFSIEVNSQFNYFKMVHQYFRYGYIYINMATSSNVQ